MMIEIGMLVLWRLQKMNPYILTGLGRLNLWSHLMMKMVDLGPQKMTVDPQRKKKSFQMMRQKMLAGLLAVMLGLQSLQKMNPCKMTGLGRLNLWNHQMMRRVELVTVLLLKMIHCRMIEIGMLVHWNLQKMNPYRMTGLGRLNLWSYQMMRVVELGLQKMTIDQKRKKKNFQMQMAVLLAVCFFFLRPNLLSHQMMKSVELVTVLLLKMIHCRMIGIGMLVL